MATPTAAVKTLPAAKPGFPWTSWLIVAGVGSVATYAWMKSTTLQARLEAEIAALTAQARAALPASLGGTPVTPVAPDQAPTVAPVPASTVASVTQTIANARAGATGTTPNAIVGDTLIVTPVAVDSNGAAVGNAAIEYRTLVTSPTGQVTPACGWIRGACQITVNTAGSYSIKTEARVVGFASVGNADASQASSASETLVVAAASTTPAGAVQLAWSAGSRGRRGRIG